jgi:aspartate aminotransferase-like enzyme
MSAPGMAFAAVAPRAWTAGETAKMPRFYLDLKRHRDTQVNGESPWTPAVAVMFQVDEGIRLMAAEGEGVYARHAACAAATRAGLRALGFALLADDAVASNTVTAAWIPEGLNWKAFNAGLKRRGLILAGGQGKLKGRIFRLGHLGAVTTDDVIGAISAIEAQAIEAGLPVAPGAGVAAAQAALIAAEVA